jgi:hypothetical protein
MEVPMCEYDRPDWMDIALAGVLAEEMDKDEEKAEQTEADGMGMSVV